jgi:hypothetical protein
MHAHARRTARPVAATAVLLALFASHGQAQAQEAVGSFQRTLTVTGPADVDVQSGSGRIEVRSGQTGRIEINARITAGHWGLFGSRVTAQERVRRIEASPPIEQSGNRVRIGRIDDEELRNHVSISYTLVVPAETTLVSKTGSGSHLIEGLHGAITASAGSGSIRIRDAGGDVRASTGSGSIHADTVAGSFVASSGSGTIDGVNVKGSINVRSGSGTIEVSQAGGGPVDASSSSGSINLTGLRCGLRASTSSGALRVQGEQTSEWRLSSSSGSVTIELAGRPAFALDAHSSSGRIDTQYPVTVAGTIGRRELRGSVNGGGPLLHVRTSSGGIRIR